MSEVARGRVLVVVAALLWSTSGVFAKSAETPAIAVAMFRGLSAGGVLLLVALLRGTRRTWQPGLLVMMASFAAMSYLFIAALTCTTAANVILLQYTAPFWVAAASGLILGESVPQRAWYALAGGLVGMAVLIGGQWLGASGGERLGMALSVASGVTYAGVIVSLRFFRGHDPLWLATLNNLAAGGVLLLGLAVAALLGNTAAADALVVPTLGEGVRLTAFGVFQMALPYVLFGYALRSVSAQEAGLLTLLEVVGNPTLTYLFVGETPARVTVVGGAVLLAMLVVRYLPAGTEPASPRQARAGQTRSGSDQPLR